MSAVSTDLMRHALTTAQKSGMNEVELEVGTSKFRAVFPLAPPAVSKSSSLSGATSASSDQQTSTGAHTKPVKSGGVGYYRAIGDKLTVGSVVEQGELLASIVALGLANDVISPASGTVIEVLIQDGDAVDFGKVLAIIGAP